jgi:hypothetical protein
VEKKHNPISNIKKFHEIKNGYYPIFPSLVLEGVFWGGKGIQRNRNVP